MKKSPLLFTGIFTLVGILYNSWPVGYLLDNTTARFGVASDLEDPSHPYAWFFITCDVITAFILVGLSMYLYFHRPKIKLQYLWLSLCFGLFIFGFFTGFGAAAPDKCTGLGSVCVNILHKRLSIDGLETSLAGLGLLIALFSSACLSFLSTKRYQIVHWLIFVLFFVAGSLLAHQVAASQNEHSIEQVFLVICGVGLISIGLMVDRAYKRSLKS